MKVKRTNSLMAAFLFAAVFALCMAPCAAWATIEQDQVALSDEEAAAALEKEQAAKPSDESEDGQAQTQDATSWIRSTNSNISTSVKVTNYAGSTAIETAAAEAIAAYPSGSSSAIIAGSGGAWVDALSASGLSASRGPLLFTDKYSLSAGAADALAQLGVQSVIVVGGPEAVSEQVVSDLEARGIRLERRLSGQDAIGTQLAVFDYGVSNALFSSKNVIVATYTSYHDMLSISPVAYALSAPVFLINETDALTDSQKDKLIEAAKQSWCQEPIVVGGTGVVSEKTQGFMNYISTLAGGSTVSTRLAGETAYETGYAIADWAVANANFTWDNVALTTFDAPYDALAGASLQGKSKALILLLEDSYGGKGTGKLSEHRGSISSLRFFGGEVALSMRARMGVADTLDFPWAALPGFKIYVDAGHGYNNTNNSVYDSGATGNGYQEAALAKELATNIAGILQNTYGVDVFLNDDGGWYKLRHAEAISQGCDAILSIHFNSGGGSGVMSLIHNTGASFLSSSWQSRLHPQLVSAMGLHDYGQRTQEVAILSGYLPATLLEIAFIDNANDMRVYQLNKATVASNIAKGAVS